MNIRNQPHERVEQIFSAARQIVSKTQREAFLEKECGDDEGLRSEIGQLLEAEQNPDSFLNRAAMEEFAPTQSTPPEACTSVGESIGNYRLLHLLGEGGMGSVYLAEQQKPVKRRVAVKIIKQGMNSHQFVARFEAERQALAMMDHPNIAKVLDAGCTDRGLPFFVMELVKGVPITNFCDDNRLTTEDRLKLFVKVCQAVQHAHQKGIIHRDLKPSNVMVAMYDDQPVPKVIDFGVAKATHQPLTEQTLYTIPGQIVGTWEYMSPEQAILNQLDVDTRTDIYSLGVILYELLTGETPLELKSLKPEALEERLRRIREEEPSRPSLRISGLGQSAGPLAAYRKSEASRLAQSLRGDLDSIVMKALEKDRSQRYETANGFAAEIRRYLDDEPLSFRPPSSWQQFRRLCRRNKSAVTTAGIGVGALAAGLAVAIWFAVHLNIEKSKTERLVSELEGKNRTLEVTVDSLRDSRAEGILEAALSGNALLARREFEEFRSSFPTDSDDARLLTNAAIIDLFKGKAERTKARETLLKAHRLAPENVSTHSLLVASHYFAGYEWDYWREVNRLTALQPHSFEDYLFRGFALAWGLPDKALEDLEAAKELDRSSAVTRVLLSNALYRMAHHTIDHREALDYAERAAEEAGIAREILFRDSPFAAAQRIYADTKRLSLYRRLQRTEDEMQQCIRDIERSMKEAEQLPYDREIHYALILADRIMHPDEFGNRNELYRAESSNIVSEHESVIVSVAKIQYHYVRDNAILPQRILEQSGEEILQSESVAMLPKIEHQVESGEDIEEIRAQIVRRLRDPHRPNQDLNGLNDWVLLTLIRAPEDAHDAGVRFRNYLEPRQTEEDIARNLLPVARFMCGDRTETEEELIGHGQTNREIVEIAFWIGIERLSQGKRSEAKRLFERVVETDFYELYDHAWSQAFLKRIHDPKWLPWLPNDQSLEQSSDSINDGK